MNAMMHTMETVDAAADSRSAVTDEELLRRYRETGDREYFAKLVSRYERELYSYLKRYLGHAEMAEDAFQASFLQVHLKAEQFAPDRRFRNIACVTLLELAFSRQFPFQCAMSARQTEAPFNRLIGEKLAIDIVNPVN